MAKILVCENREYTGRLLVEECEKDDHIAFLLARDFDSNYVLDNLKKVVLEFQPDYMIIDHLRNRCFEAINLAKRVKPNIVAIVHTTHLDILEEANKMGIPFYEKHSCQKLDNMFMYILEHQKLVKSQIL